MAYCPALSIERRNNRFLITTAQGAIDTRDVVIATNGYTGSLTPWLKRRVIPIGSYMIATEMLDQAMVDELIPKTALSATPARSSIIIAHPLTAGASCSADASH